ncbi:SLBB domain-containing protein [Halosquirtibacter laminarini]|uniref:SLBB domain-containing protein n=1 Tax=Halosquirtibacter laminarini TaxID=3374600 RepID=A0AC61NNW5_9BACT|nr:SLBB domain-containing protein [Prolixibacteraceae bacterium]
MKTKILLLFAIIFFGLKLAVAQSVNIATVDVNTLSEDQLLKIKNEIDSRGVTIDQAMILAKQKGASDFQISMLKKRLNTLSFNSSKNTSEQQSTEEKTVDDTNLVEQNDSPIRIQDKQNIDPRLKRIFGASLFYNDAISFSPSSIINVTDDYLISIGDEVSIQVWGDAQATYQLPVNQSGAIQLPNLGPIYINGKTSREAFHKIDKMLTKIYAGMSGPNPTIFTEISLSSQHKINVLVMGDVQVPGSYKLPANSTAFNAIFSCGGPNINGSFRDIRVIRNNMIIAHLDLYDFFIKGIRGEDPQLRDNDVIYIPNFKNRVELRGAFRRNMMYELLKGETLQNAIDYSGGFANNSYNSRVKILRNSDGLKEISVVKSEDFDKFKLYDGDIVSSDSVLNKFKNKVIIKGAVFRPGSYELKDGMLLSGLLQTASGLREDAYLERGFITRRDENMQFANLSFSLKDILNNKDDVVLRADDVISIRSIYDMSEIKKVSVFGELNAPGDFPFVDDMTLEDLIVKAGGFSNDADASFVEVTRNLSQSEAQTLSDTISHYFSFALDRDLSLSEDAKKFHLKPFDIIYIRRAPGRRKSGSVKLNGEILYAGDYGIISKQDHVSDIINRAGGLTPDAFTEGAMLIRKRDKKNATGSNMKKLFDNEDLILELEDSDTEIVGIDLDKIMKDPHGNFDILVRAGDKIHIPKRTETVRVSGNIMNPIASIYKKGQKLKSYINKSGGFGPHSKKSKVYVVYANGTTAVTKNYLFFKNYPKIEPGSEIVVPRKTVKQDQTTKWVSIGSSVTSLAVAVATLVNLTK